MDTTLLLVHQSGEGQTTKIADRIASRLAEAGAVVDRATADSDPDPSGYGGVVVGDSIHLGAHSVHMTEWLADHASELEQVPTALFQVSLASALQDEAHEAEAQQMLDDVLDQTSLDPVLVGLFAGTLAYTKYGRDHRQMLRRMAGDAGHPTDTSRDHELTDWDVVDQFADDVLTAIRG